MAGKLASRLSQSEIGSNSHGPPSLTPTAPPFASNRDEQSGRFLKLSEVRCAFQCISAEMFGRRAVAHACFFWRTRDA